MNAPLGRRAGPCPIPLGQASRGLVVTGKLIATAPETGLGVALTRLLAGGGEPVIRRGEKNRLPWNEPPPPVSPLQARQAPDPMESNTC